MNLRFLVILLFVTGLALLPPSAGAWGVGHRIITEAALAVQSEALRTRWQALHVNAHLGKEATVEWYVANHFSKLPDWVDGPSRSGEDLKERVRATGFVYAERNGTFLPPITYAGPDRDGWEGPRPKTYHYFTFNSEEVSREFARKGSRWYFRKISEALREGEDVIAAEYFGAFAHAIQDRVSPYHVWDGYSEDREAFEDTLVDEGLQTAEGSWKGNPGSSSMFWAVGGQGMSADLADYSPRSLGKNVDEASREFVERLFQSREFARDVYTNREGFVRSHLTDEWRERGSSGATDEHLGRVADENARLTADVLHTAFLLAGEAEARGEARP